MEIVYKVDDGYINPGPMYLNIDDDELAECETLEEKKALINQLVNEDFQQSVSWYFETDIDEALTCNHK